MSTLEKWLLLASVFPLAWLALMLPDWVKLTYAAICAVIIIWAIITIVVPAYIVLLRHPH